MGNNRRNKEKYVNPYFEQNQMGTGGFGSSGGSLGYDTGGFSTGNTASKSFSTVENKDLTFNKDVDMQNDYQKSMNTTFDSSQYGMPSDVNDVKSEDAGTSSNFSSNLAAVDTIGNLAINTIGDPVLDAIGGKTGDKGAFGDEYLMTRDAADIGADRFSQSDLENMSASQIKTPSNSQGFADGVTGMFDATNEDFEEGGLTGMLAGSFGNLYDTIGSAGRKKEAYADLQGKWNTAQGNKNMREGFQQDSTDFRSNKALYEQTQGLNKSANAGMGSVNLAEMGGSLDTKANGNEKVTYINGPSHQGNPLGGIPMGSDSNGIPNTVEGGEIKFESKGGTYIFSDKLY